MKTFTRYGLGMLALGLMAAPTPGRAQDHRMLDLNSLPSPMEAIRTVQNTGRALFIMADSNHDGQISQQEAVDVNDLLVGGFFFRADADGNGAVTEQEAKVLTDKYFDQNPWARYVVESLKSQVQEKQRAGQNNTANNAALNMLTLIDTNNDRQLQATELRQFVQTLTQSFFAAADTNRDGQMSPAEINAAVAGGIRAIAQQSFQQADTDRNGQLSRAEYDRAIIEPANMLFQIIDLNHDGELSQQETQQVERALLAQIRMLQVPEAPNSLTNLIESGRMPRDAAPVPTFGAPNTNNNNPNSNSPAPRQPNAPR
jgi:Ca2+-binding EF-hand superfamily protein